MIAYVRERTYAINNFYTFLRLLYGSRILDNVYRKCDEFFIRETRLRRVEIEIYVLPTFKLLKQNFSKNYIFSRIIPDTRTRVIF